MKIVALAAAAVMAASPLSAAIVSYSGSFSASNFLDNTLIEFSGQFESPDDSFSPGQTDQAPTVTNFTLGSTEYGFGDVWTSADWFFNGYFGIGGIRNGVFGIEPTVDDFRVTWGAPTFRDFLRDDFELVVDVAEFNFADGPTTPMDITSASFSVALVSGDAARFGAAPDISGTPPVFGGGGAAVVPLPAAGWLLLAGLGALAAVRRRA